MQLFPSTKQVNSGNRRNILANTKRWAGPIRGDGSSETSVGLPHVNIMELRARPSPGIRPDPVRVSQQTDSARGTG